MPCHLDHHLHKALHTILDAIQLIGSPLIGGVAGVGNSSGTDDSSWWYWWG
jgi:hypothetical protein